MRIDKVIRIALTAFIVVLFLAVLAIGLYLTESAFTVWDRLRSGPSWLLVLYVAAFALALAGTLWLIVRLVLPSRGSGLAAAEAVPTEAGVDARVAAAEALGVEVAAVRRELADLAERRETGKLYVAMFGEISTGKSSLIKALLGADAAIETSVRGGSTREIRDYLWRSPGGAEVVLTDVPGLNEAAGRLEQVAREEALRAHVVVFVSDSDLTRAEFDTLRSLAELQRPLIVALNKADRYAPEELAAIRERLQDRLESATGAGAKPALVAVAAGMKETVVRVGPDGVETRLEREAAPRVEPLQDALNWVLAAKEDLEKKRDSAVFVLASRKLDRAEAHYRETRAQEIVRGYTRKAVVGALAAVAPGTDLLIQGYLGTSMVKEMCGLYDAPVKDLDVENFMTLAQKKVARAGPLLLAVAGNGLKAFPGIGTVAGGLAHAVAYGLIFDALGASLARSLERGEGLRPKPAASLFQETLGEDLEARARRIARLALTRRGKSDADRR